MKGPSFRDAERHEVPDTAIPLSDSPRIRRNPPDALRAGD